MNLNIYKNRVLIMCFLAFLLTQTALFSQSESSFDEFDEFSDEVTITMGTIDPLYYYNKGATKFNDIFFVYVLGPLSEGYGLVVPKTARHGVSNFFRNVAFPVRFFNNLFQLKFKNAGTELSRFAINSTVGVFGLFDPAKAWFDLEPKKEDFGQTLGKYGVGEGFYFVVPFIGPSNARDAFGLIIDGFADPFNQLDLESNITARTAEMTNYISLTPNDYMQVRGASVDFYSFLKDANRQLRRRLIEE